MAGVELAGEIPRLVICQAGDFSIRLNFRGYYADMIDYLDEPEGYRNFVKKLLADEK